MMQEVKKEVPPSKRSKNFYLREVLSGIQQGKSPSIIANNLGVSKQSLQYHLSRLKQYEIIEKISYGVWQIKNTHNLDLITSKKKVQKIYGIGQPHTPQQVKKIRGHGFVFTVKISTIKNWENRIDYLQKKNIHYKPIPQGQSILIHNHKVWLCQRSIVIHFQEGKSYFSSSAFKSSLEALYHCKKIIMNLETILDIDFKINGQWNITTSRQHFAQIENELAKDYDKKRKVLFVRNKYGKLIFLIDNSFNLHEFEAVNPPTAIKDMDNVVVPFFNDLLEHPETPKPSEIYKIVSAVTQNQSIFAENMVSHIQAVKDLSVGTQQLGSGVKVMTDTISNLTTEIHNIKTILETLKRR